jgi:predicted acetyltransferase
MRLVAASLDPPEGLEAFLIEVGRGEFGFSGTDFAPPNETLTDLLQRLVDFSEGRGINPDWVPFTTYWLLDELGSVVGMRRLRHKLNTEALDRGGRVGYYVRRSARGKGFGTSILAMTLEEGRRRGIERFLLAVNSANIPSIRVIEGTGGVLEDERIDRDTGRPYRRYWIG